MQEDWNSLVSMWTEGRRPPDNHPTTPHLHSGVESRKILPAPTLGCMFSKEVWYSDTHSTELRLKGLNPGRIPL